MGIKWKNNKTGNIYETLDVVTNATNTQDGQKMILYRDMRTKQQYVREKTEFLKKFTRCKEGGC